MPSEQTGQILLMRLDQATTSQRLSRDVGDMVLACTRRIIKQTRTWMGAVQAVEDDWSEQHEITIYLCIPACYERVGINKFAQDLRLTNHCAAASILLTYKSICFWRY